MLTFQSLLGDELEAAKLIFVMLRIEMMGDKFSDNQDKIEVTLFCFKLSTIRCDSYF